MSQRINYVTQLNNFCGLTGAGEIPASAQAVYLHLLDINNRAMWEEWFDVSTVSLAGRTAMKRATVIKARDTLVSFGLIEMERTRSNAYRIKIIPLDDESTVQIRHRIQNALSKMDTATVQNGYSTLSKMDTATVSKTDSPIYIKQKHINSKPITHHDDVSTNIVGKSETWLKATKMYEEKFGNVNGYIGDMLADLLQEVGEVHFRRALEIAAENNKSAFRYIQAVARSQKAGTGYARTNRQERSKGGYGRFPGQEPGRFDHLLVFAGEEQDPAGETG